MLLNHLFSIGFIHPFYFQPSFPCTTCINNIAVFVYDFGEGNLKVAGLFYSCGKIL